MRLAFYFPPDPLRPDVCIGSRRERRRDQLQKTAAFRRRRHDRRERRRRGRRRDLVRVLGSAAGTAPGIRPAGAEPRPGGRRGVAGEPTQGAGVPRDALAALRSPAQPQTRGPQADHRGRSGRRRRRNLAPAPDAGPGASTLRSGALQLPQRGPQGHPGAQVRAARLQTRLRERGQCSGQEGSLRSLTNIIELLSS